MNEFLMFLMDNYIWILVVIVLIIITIIGFLADKNKTKEKKEIKESTPVSQVDMPTFIHDGNVSTQKDLLQQESSAGNEEPKVVENNPQNNILNNTMPEQNKVENNLPQPMMTNNNQGLNSQPIQNTIHGPMSTPMGVNTTIPQPMNIPQMQPQQQPIVMNNYTEQMPVNNLNTNISNNQSNYVNNGMQQTPIVNNQNINNSQQYGGQQYGMNPNQNIYKEQMPVNNNSGMVSSPIQNTIPGPMSTPMGVNTTIPQPMNVPPMQPQQPVIPQPVNTAPVHEPIKVSPIPGMTGSAVSFVNGPTNNNPNQQ